MDDRRSPEPEAHLSPPAAAADSPCYIPSTAPDSFASFATHQSQQSQPPQQSQPQSQQPQQSQSQQSQSQAQQSQHSEEKGGLRPASADRVNRDLGLSLPSSTASAISTIRSSFHDSAVLEKISQFNSLSSQAQHQVDRNATAARDRESSSHKDARQHKEESAIKRANMGREEAEAEMRRYRDEARQLRRKLEEGQERERKTAERLDATMEKHTRAKETYAHTQELWEKEIRRTRKEAFKAQSASVKLQEELKMAREMLKLANENLDREKERSKTRENEAFNARYQLVGVQEELEAALEHIKVAEQERDTFKALAKKEEVARLAAEAQPPHQPNTQPTSTHQTNPDPDTHMAERLPEKPVNKITEKLKRFHGNRISISAMDLVSSEASELEIEELSRRVSWERQRADRAQELLEFLQMECKLRCCPCIKEMRAEKQAEAERAAAAAAERQKQQEAEEEARAKAEVEQLRREREQARLNRNIISRSQTPSSDVQQQPPPPQSQQDVYMQSQLPQSQADTFMLSQLPSTQPDTYMQSQQSQADTFMQSQPPATQADTFMQSQPDDVDMASRPQTQTLPDADDHADDNDNDDSETETATQPNTQNLEPMSVAASMAVSTASTESSKMLSVVSADSSKMLNSLASVSLVSAESSKMLTSVAESSEISLAESSKMLTSVTSFNYPRPRPHLLHSIVSDHMDVEDSREFDRSESVAHSADVSTASAFIGTAYDRRFMRTPSLELPLPSRFALLAHDRVSLMSLLNAPHTNLSAAERQSLENSLASIPTVPEDAASASVPIPAEPEVRHEVPTNLTDVDDSFVNAPAPAEKPRPAPYTTATGTVTTTTKVPLRTDSDTSAHSNTPTLADQLRAQMRGVQTSFDATNPAMTPTMTREEALAQIRERRGRARSAAQGAATPHRQMLQGVKRAGSSAQSARPASVSRREMAGGTGVARGPPSRAPLSTPVSGSKSGDSSRSVSRTATKTR